MAAAEASNVPMDFFSAATMVFSSVRLGQNSDISSFWQEVGNRLWEKKDFTVDQTRYLFAYGCAIALVKRWQEAGQYNLTDNLERVKEDASLSCLGVMRIEKENDSLLQRISGRRSKKRRELTSTLPWLERYFEDPQKRARIVLLAQTPKMK